MEIDLFSLDGDFFPVVIGDFSFLEVSLVGDLLVLLVVFSLRETFSFLFASSLLWVLFLLEIEISFDIDEFGEGEVVDVLLNLSLEDSFETGVEVSLPVPIEVLLFWWAETLDSKAFLASDTCKTNYTRINILKIIS